MNYITSLLTFNFTKFSSTNHFQFFGNIGLNIFPESFRKLLKMQNGNHPLKNDRPGFPRHSQPNPRNPRRRFVAADDPIDDPSVRGQTAVVVST